MNVGSIPQLLPVQGQDARTIAKWSNTLLSYEPGSGKTPTAIVGASLAAPGDPWFVVTVRNAKEQWRKELAKWAPQQKNVFVTHYEDAKNHIAAGQQARVVFLDEGRIGCHVDTDIFKVLYQICRQPTRWGGSRKVIELEGTPVPNAVVDLLGQLILLGVFDLHQYNQLVAHFCDPQLKGFGEKLDVRGAANLDYMRQILGRVLIRRRYSDLGISLPPVYLENIPADLAAAGEDGQRYLEASANFATWYKAHRGRPAAGYGSQVVLRRLLALAKVPASIAQAKNDLAAGRRLLGFSEFREPVQQMHAAFKGSGLVLGGDTEGNRAETIESIQGAPGAGALFTSRDALGSAMNMNPFNVCGFNDLGWVPGDFDQAYKRAWRYEKKEPLKLWRTYVPGDPLENHIRETLLWKEDILRQLGLEPTGSLTQFQLAA